MKTAEEWKREAWSFKRMSDNDIRYIQTDARREPLEVLKECQALMAGCAFAPGRTQRLRDGIKALLADAPKRTEPTAGGG